MKKTFSIAALLLVCIAPLTAQTNLQELTQIVLKNDSLFWLGYNTCDTALTGKFIAEDVEFYHDKGGITNGKQGLQASLKNNLCSRPDWHLRREAIAETIKLYPMQDNGTIYGAILVGQHYFYVTEKGKPEYRTGHALFTHLWQKKDGAWKMTRILSYDHGAPEKGGERKAIVVPANVLKQYLGAYKGPQTNNLLIQQEQNNLVLVNNNNKLVLYAEAANKFFAKERDLSFEFLLDENKKVTGLHVREGGAIVEELKPVK